MTILEAIICGIVQGITEFLPVSSSGHLVLIRELFGVKQPTIFFDICLHLATVFAVIIFFNRVIITMFQKRDFKSMLLIIVATIPAVAAGVLLGSQIENFFSNPLIVSIMLIATGLMLLGAQYAVQRKDYPNKEIGFGHSVVIGIAQAFSLLPGISRSGATISAALFGGVKIQEAFKFSFLMSIPVIFGAALFHWFKIEDFEAVVYASRGVYFWGMLTAFIGGLLSLYVLLWFIQRKKLHYFGMYCIALGIISIILIRMGI